MRPRQPLPRLWLMTDERQGERLWDSLARLPKRSGIVFRHYGLPPQARLDVWLRVRDLARERELVLIAAGGPLPGGDGCHNRRGRGIRTASAHNLHELRDAERTGAHLVFLSPVFVTRSHPQARPLGAERFSLLAHQAKVPVIALGGMTAERARTLRGAYGWAGIDAFAARA